MSKKIPLGISLACIFLSVALTVAVTVSVFNKRYNSLIHDLPQRIKQYSKLSEVDEIVRSEYFGAVDSEKLEADIAAGYVDGLNDPYSFYISAEEYEIYENYLKGHITGTGINVKYDSLNSCMRVVSVDTGSSGEEAGIKENDLIFSVDGENVEVRNYSVLAKKLGGDAEKTIKLGLTDIDADGNTSRRSVTVTNGYDDISCKWTRVGDIAYMRLSAFYENTYQTFSLAVDEMTEAGVSGLIIDVRNNDSTNIDAAVKIIDRIVPLASEGTGAIASAKNSKGETVAIYSSDSECLFLPIVVLINSGTNGAAELFACDLRDFGKAHIIGERTAGNGSMQKLFRLNDGAAVVLSVAKIYPYISECYDGKGVAPDDEILYETDLYGKISLPPSEDDLQYRAAYAYLSK